MASASGCWKSLHQQYYRSLAYFLAECSSLAWFPNGHLYFCHLSPVQVAIPPQKFQPQQDSRWTTERLQHPLYTVTISHWFPKQQNITTPRSVTLNWFLFCLQHGAFLPLWNPLLPANSEFHSKALNSNLSTFLYFFRLQMQTVRSVLLVTSTPRWWKSARQVDIAVLDNPGGCNSNSLQSYVLKIIYNL